MVSLFSCRKVALVFATLGILIAPTSSKAASAVYDSACDTSFMNALKDKAWMEAQREMMHNQQMVWKPDSVLALGCYKHWIDGLKGTISFSNDNGSGLNSLGSDASSYLSSAFNHTLAGGNGSGSNSSNCGNIATLWQYSRCKNLNLTQIQTLKDVSGSDPRVAPGGACGSTGGWSGPAGNAVAVAWGTTFDSMNLFTNVVAPLSEVSGGKCSVGIPTGVKIGGGSNPEIVCPNPGCSPDGTAHPKCCKSGTTSNCSAALP